MCAVLELVLFSANFCRYKNVLWRVYEGDKFHDKVITSIFKFWVIMISCGVIIWIIRRISAVIMLVLYKEVLEWTWIIISLLITPLLGHKPSLWITHKENGRECTWIRCKLDFGLCNAFISRVLALISNVTCCWTYILEVLLHKKWPNTMFLLHDSVSPGL
jgi:hypothetical protein